MQHKEPEDLVLSLTRLRDFFVKRGVKELMCTTQTEDDCIPACAFLYVILLLKGNHGQSRQFYGPGRGVSRAVLDQFYRRLVERVYAQGDPEVVFLTTALMNFLGHDNRGDPPTEVLLMAAWGEQENLDHPSLRVLG